MSGDEESAGFPAAPPSFGHPEPETPAKVTVPGGFRPPGPPVEPWWAPEAPAAPSEPHVEADPLPGVLVAGPGIPVVDTRRAVPREPLVRQVFLAETTDPDGFPAITQDTVVDLVRPQSPQPSPTLVDSVLLTWQPLEAGHPLSPPEDAPAPEAPMAPAKPSQATWPAPPAEAPSDQQAPEADPQQPAAENTWQALETAQAVPSHEIPQEPVAGETWQPSSAAATAPGTGQEIGTAAWPMPGQPADQRLPHKPGTGETWQPAAAATAVPSTDQRTDTRAEPGQTPGDEETWQPAAAAKAEPVGPAVPVVPMFDTPVLVPAAILPPPTVAPVKPTPEQAIAAKTVLAILTPVEQEQEQPMPPAPARVGSTRVRASRKPRSKQSAWLAVFLLVPATVAGSIGYLITTGSDSAKKQPVAATQPTTPAAAATTATASPSASAAASPRVTGSLPGGPSVDSDKTDPKPLTIRELFPIKRVPLSNSLFVQDYKSLNKRCDYAASGVMAVALLRANCQGVVRSTFLTKNKKIGVTTGVVAMPTKSAAIHTSKAGDPARLEWFRVMPGKRTQALLDGGGHAASTTYGRYIIYAYVQYLDGTTATPGDPTLIQVAKDFIGYLNEPLKAR